MATAFKNKSTEELTSARDKLEADIAGFIAKLDAAGTKGSMASKKADVGSQLEAHSGLRDKIQKELDAREFEAPSEPQRPAHERLDPSRQWMGLEDPKMAPVPREPPAEVSEVARAAYPPEDPITAGMEGITPEEGTDILRLGAEFGAGLTPADIPISAAYLAKAIKEKDVIGIALSGMGVVPGLGLFGKLLKAIKAGDRSVDTLRAAEKALDDPGVKKALREYSGPPITSDVIEQTWQNSYRQHNPRAWSYVNDRLTEVQDRGMKWDYIGPGQGYVGWAKNQEDWNELVALHGQVMKAKREGLVYEMMDGYAHGGVFDADTFRKEISEELREEADSSGGYLSEYSRELYGAMFDRLGVDGDEAIKNFVSPEMRKTPRKPFGRDYDLEPYEQFRFADKSSPIWEPPDPYYAEDLKKKITKPAQAAKTAAREADVKGWESPYFSTSRLTSLEDKEFMWYGLHEKWRRAGSKMPPIKTEEQVAEALDQVAHAQRGLPEETMLKLQRSNQFSPAYNGAAENVGDVINRMSEKASHHAPEAWLKPKIHSALSDIHLMEDSIEMQLRENLGQIKESGLTLDQAREEMRRLGQEYADAHRTLPVYNEVQMLANDAAIAFGEWRFDDARVSLQKLLKYVDSEDWYDKLMRVQPGYARPGVKLP